MRGKAQIFLREPVFLGSFTRKSGVQRTPPPHAHLNFGAHILRKSQFGKYSAEVLPVHLLLVQQCNCWWPVNLVVSKLD
jgi:hypothetical protein